MLMRMQSNRNSHSFLVEVQNGTVLWKTVGQFLLCPLTIHMLKPYPANVVSIRSWGLWEVIRIGWGHVGNLMKKISSLIRVTRELASLLCSPSREDTEKSANLEEGPHQNSTVLAPWSQTSSPQTVRNKFSLSIDPTYDTLLEWPELRYMQLFVAALFIKKCTKLEIIKMPFSSKWINCDTCIKWIIKW